MTIVNCKIATFWPISALLHFLLLRFSHVQDDRHSIFVVSSLDSLMRISRIWNY